MSLSAWEQQALDSIKDGLAGSDPTLVARLTIFTRLASDEEMPAREKIQAGSRQAVRRSRHEPPHTRRADQRLGLLQAVPLLLWLVTTVALITVALTSNRVSQGTCTGSWATFCTAGTSAASSPAGIPRTGPGASRLLSVAICEAMTMADGMDRKLVLLRHAKSAWPDVPDHERPLGPRGQRDAPVMGRWLRAAGHVPDQVLCSTARRARQTWQLAQAGLGATPPASFDDGVYEGSAAQLLDLIRRAPPAPRTLLVIGHGPGIPELALALTAATPAARGGAAGHAATAAMLGRMRAKFPTAAIAVLEFAGNWDQLAPGTARLTSFVTPRDLPGQA